ncbi:MAG TPA: hypothetical protein VNA20_16140 [Frankiaceae bacterium]|nr:hypothetical protein [Frankiaceae bacterium]
MRFDGDCDANLDLNYEDGQHVPLCWEPGCWVVVRAGAPPWTPCGPESFRAPPDVTSGAVTSLVYDPTNYHCFAQLPGEQHPFVRDDPRDCLYQCSRHYVVVIEPDLSLTWDSEVCGTRVLNHAPTPPVPAPLSDRYPEPVVGGAKLTRSSLRHAFPLAPAIGRLLAADDTEVPRRDDAAGAGIVAAPPPRRIDGVDGQGFFRLAGAALLALLLLAAAPRRPRGRHRHGAPLRVST